MMEQIILDEIVNELLHKLRKRPRQIIAGRFGLDKKSPKVLNELGKEFGVTRERIRQIERDSFKKLRKARKDENFYLLIGQTMEVLKKNGGFMIKGKLKERLKKNLTQNDRNKLMFILNSSGQLWYKKKSCVLSGFWLLKKNVTMAKKINEAHRFLVKYIKKEKSPQEINILLNHVRNSAWKIFFEGRTGQLRLESILIGSRIIGKNIINEWGLKNWKIISEMGTRERAFLSLKKHGRPLHYTKVTKLIDKHWGEKKALSQTVHNELIKNGQFVLLGRGVYGLNEWEFAGGTVREIILVFFQKKKRPLNQKEIISHVLSKKKVKQVTILTMLADKNFFQKTKTGLFLPHAELKLETKEN